MNLPILRAEHVKTWFPVRGLAGRPAGTVLWVRPAAANPHWAGL